MVLCSTSVGGFGRSGCGVGGASGGSGGGGGGGGGSVDSSAQSSRPQITRVTGKMVIWINGEQIYQKGGFSAENPQPTPGEVEVLMGECFPSLPWTDDEAAAFQALHEEQKRRGKAKH